jgi:Uma2 family endonuclease
MAALGEPLLMTVEQFQALPERGDVREELHWGQLVALSRPRPWHVKLQVRLAELLQPVAGGRGYILYELPFRAVAEYDLRAADVAFISKARWEAVDEGDLEGAPELVIEIISPSNTKTHLREYAALCLANGCEEFWAIDRKRRNVTVTDRNAQSIEYSSGMNVPLTVLSGTSIAVDRIFVA